MFGFYAFGHPYFGQGPGEVAEVRAFEFCDLQVSGLGPDRGVSDLTPDRSVTFLGTDRAVASYCANEE